VTMRWWNDLWLNKSFAEFMSHLAAAANTRWTEAWTTFQASEKTRGYAQDQLPSTHPIVADIRDLADVEVNFDMITYAKGASVLRQLVAYVGQDNFLAGVSAYLKKHAYGNATLDDLLAELAAASGRDLGSWSKVWLEEPGVVVLRPEIGPGETPLLTESALSGGGIEPVTVPAIALGVAESFAITQEVPAIYQSFADIPHRGVPAIDVRFSLKPHRIAIAGYVFGQDRDDDGIADVTEAPGEVTPPADPLDAGRPGLARAWRIETDIDGARTEIPELAGQVLPDLTLINDGDLTFAKIRLDDESLATAESHLGDVKDSLARALIWGSLWDAVRDGEMPARRYVDTVLRHVDRETNPTAIQTLLQNLAISVRYYVAPDLAGEVLDNAAAELVKLAVQADPGSDAQLQFVKVFAHLADNASQWDFLDGVYDGSGEVPGLVVDTDLRWELLVDLVAAGRRGEADIVAQQERDQTARGKEWAAQARAAIPTPAAKKAAWATAVHDASISNWVQRCLVAGFTQVKDPALLEDFVPEYFAAVEQVWAARSLESSKNIVEGRFPIQSLGSAKADLMGQTARFLGRLADRQPALRRLIVEHRAAVVRALAARKADAAVD